MSARDWHVRRKQRVGKAGCPHAVLPWDFWLQSPPYSTLTNNSLYLTPAVLSVLEFSLFPQWLPHLDTSSFCPHPSHYISFPLLLLLLMTQFPISALPSFLPRCFPASAPFSLTLYVPDGYFLNPEGSKDARSVSGCNGALPWPLFPSWDKRSWELILLMLSKYMLF